MKHLLPLLLLSYALTGCEMVDHDKISASLDISSQVFRGRGTVSDPYLIESVPNFIEFIQNMEIATSNTHYRITRNLDLAGTPNICTYYQGNTLRTFRGTLDGGNYEIRNLTADGQHGCFNGWGLIPRNLGTIRNIRLYQSHLTNMASRSGTLVGTNHRFVQDIYIYGTASGQHYATGGIVGENVPAYTLFNELPVIERVVADVQVTGKSTVGGIVGVNSGLVLRATVLGSVEGVYVGNLSSEGRAGGIAGLLATVPHPTHHARIEASTSSAAIRGYTSVGGIVGENAGGIIDRCSNFGTVEARSPSENRPGLRSMAGGIAGIHGTAEVYYLSKDAYIMDSFSQGLISFDNIRAGRASGLVGYLQDTTPSNAILPRIWNSYTTSPVYGPGARIVGQRSSGQHEIFGTFFRAAWAHGGSAPYVACGDNAPACGTALQDSQFYLPGTFIQAGWNMNYWLVYPDRFPLHR